uniref:Uncharacterized protein n=1 Tax=Caenorhabditis japonica TaxID=281687 RepID=A0A8R1EJZ6_CAEJA
MVNPAARGQSAAVSHYHPPRQETLSAHINEESSSLSSTDSRENSVNPYAIPHAQGRPNQSPSTRTVQVPLEVEATAQQGEQLYYSRPPQNQNQNVLERNEAYSDPPPYCSMVGNNDNNDYRYSSCGQGEPTPMAPSMAPLASGDYSREEQEQPTPPINVMDPGFYNMLAEAQKGGAPADDSGPRRAHPVVGNLRRSLPELQSRLEFVNGTLEMLKTANDEFVHMLDLRNQTLWEINQLKSLIALRLRENPVQSQVAGEFVCVFEGVNID